MDSRELAPGSATRLQTAPPCPQLLRLPQSLSRLTEDATVRRASHRTCTAVAVPPTPSAISMPPPSRGVRAVPGGTPSTS